MRTRILVLVMCILANNTGCLIRTQIPPDSHDLNSHMDTIYVYLKPGIAYSDGHAIKLERPRIEGDYLYGLSGDTERSIAVEDIDWIEVLRMDQKKVIIATSVIGVY